MTGYIFRGSTPRIKMKPPNGFSVSDLGIPTIIFSQDFSVLEKSGNDIEIDAANNAISVKLTEAETLAFDSSAKVSIQQIWHDDESANVVRFPVHQIGVMNTLVDSVLEG